MKKTILLSVMSAAMLAMGNVSAGGGSLFGGSGASSSIMSGLYAGGSYGLAATNCMIHDSLGLEEDCDTNGWKAFAGYRINEMLAIEGGYYDLGDAEETITFPNSGYSHPGTGVVVQSASAEGSATGLGLSGVVNYNLMDNLDVFGKLGAIKYTSEGTLTANTLPSTLPRDASVDGVSLLWGVGGNYKFTDNLGIRGEYEGFTREDVHGEERDVGIMSAGVTFSTY